MIVLDKFLERAMHTLEAIQESSEETLTVSSTGTPKLRVVVSVATSVKTPTSYETLTSRQIRGEIATLWAKNLS